MHKISGPGATAQNTFTKGDPATGTPATEVTQEWLNTMQAELVYLVEQAGLTLDSANDTQVKAAIDALIAAGSNSIPVGAAVPFFGGTVHTGFLKANGAAVSRTTYAALFAEIGTLYGAGDGTTTFNLPDSRGEFLRGWDDARGIDVGRALGSWQADDFKSHTHGQSLNGNAAGTGSVGTQGNASLDNATVGITAATGGTETRPRNLAVQFLIKY